MVCGDPYDRVVALRACLISRDPSLFATWCKEEGAKSLAVYLSSVLVLLSAARFVSKRPSPHV